MQEVQEMQFRSLGGKDPLEKEMVIHSSILAWKIPWTEEPGGLQFMGSQRAGHDWAHILYSFTVWAAREDPMYKWPPYVIYIIPWENQKYFLALVVFFLVMVSVFNHSKGLEWIWCVEHMRCVTISVSKDVRSRSEGCCGKVGRGKQNTSKKQSVKSVLLSICCSGSQLRRTLCDPTNCIQHARPLCPPPFLGACSNSCPLSRWRHPSTSSSAAPFPFAFNLSQHLVLFQWVCSSYQVAKVLEFQLQHQSFQWIFSTCFLWDWLVGSPCSPRDSQQSSPTPQFTSINSLALSRLYGPTLTFMHEYWKNHSFDYRDVCWQSNASAF